MTLQPVVNACRGFRKGKCYRLTMGMLIVVSRGMGDPQGHQEHVGFFRYSILGALVGGLMYLGLLFILKVFKTSREPSMVKETVSSNVIRKDPMQDRKYGTQ